MNIIKNAKKNPIPMTTPFLLSAMRVESDDDSVYHIQPPLGVEFSSCPPWVSTGRKPDVKKKHNS
jgi:hypothetical protein